MVNILWVGFNDKNLIIYLNNLKFVIMYFDVVVVKIVILVIWYLYEDYYLWVLLLLLLCDLILEGFGVLFLKIL